MITDSMIAELIPPTGAEVLACKKKLGPMHIGFLVVKLEDAINTAEIKTCGEMTEYLSRELQDAFPGSIKTLLPEAVSSWLQSNKSKFNVAYLNCLQN